MTDVLLVLLKVSVGAIILAIGTGSTLSELTYLWRRPGLLLRSLLAMYVLVPLAAFLLVTFLPLPVPTKAALLVLAVSAGAPLLPKKLGPVAGSGYAFSLVVTSSLLAIVLVPAWVALLANHFAVDVEVTPRLVAKALAKALLLPLLIGMSLRAVWPRGADALSERVLRTAGLVLSGCGLLLLVTHWEVVAQVSIRGAAALIALMTIALAIGHLLGGPHPEDRTTLAIACATRHIGIAVLVATAFPGPRTAVLMAAYLLCSALVSIPYLRWRRRVAAAA